MKANVNNILVSASTLIAEHGHCQGADATDADGRAVLPHSRMARTWCVTGAIHLAGRDADARDWLDALRAFAAAVGYDSKVPVSIKWEDAPATVRDLCEAVWRWEDLPGRTHRHVLAAFEQAKEHVR